MADAVEVIEQGIRRSRRAFEANITELHTRAEAASDWNAHYRTHMGAVLGAALAGGIVVGSLTRGQRRTALWHGPVGQAASHAVEALLATAMSAAVAFVADVIPGFDEQYRRSSARA